MIKITNGLPIIGLRSTKCKIVEIIPRFQYGFMVFTTQAVFDDTLKHSKVDGEPLTKVHENSIFLYRSPQAESALRQKGNDYVILFFFAAAALGPVSIAVLPLTYLLVQSVTLSE